MDTLTQKQRDCFSISVLSSLNYRHFPGDSGHAVKFLLTPDFMSTLPQPPRHTAASGTKAREQVEVNFFIYNGTDFNPLHEILSIYQIISVI